MERSNCHKWCPSLILVGFGRVASVKRLSKPSKKTRMKIKKKKSQVVWLLSSLAGIPWSAVLWSLYHGATSKVESAWAFWFRLQVLWLVSIPAVWSSKLRRRTKTIFSRSKSTMVSTIGNSSSFRPHWILCWSYWTYRPHFWSNYCLFRGYCPVCLSSCAYTLE